MSRTKRLLRGLGAASVLSLGLGATAMGCLNRPIDRIDPRTTSTVVERLQQNGVDKIDLLLAVDNSISMADKQAILAAAVPDLVNRLVTPNCVDDMGVATGQTVDTMGECPDGSKPEFPPIRNINVGIISSSLGDLTSGSCQSATVLHPDDKAHLLSRGGAGTVPTFENKGFLAWDPDNQRGGETDAANLAANLGDLVVGVDQRGCGYEMQLESILRFLVDPDPYESLVRNGSYLEEQGTDTVVLQQRADFLRPDSLLAILILSDENDCSVNTGPDEQGFLVLSSAPFFRSTSECATDPNSDCCTSCGLDIPSGCDAGNACATPNYTQAEDHPNLKCFNQKQRYGANFLYPVQRYINAFTQIEIDPSRTDYAPADPANAVTSPLFQDLSGQGGNIRSPDLVFVAGIVGVPWQKIARNPADLSEGFKTFGELEADLNDLIGDPDGNEPPSDPWMIESVNERPGVDAGNEFNGNDYSIPDNDNLQYACIFPLVTPVPNGPDCDCVGAGCNNPLCDTTDQTLQINAKAYPGLRELALLRGMGSQGIFASICPAEVNDTNAADYGYRPAVNSIIDRLKEELGGQCLARELTADSEGNVPCLVIEAAATAGSCNCDSDGRAAIPEQLDGAPNPTYNAVLAAKEDPFANPNWDCFCEIQQLTGDQRETCQNDTDPQSTGQGDGWCYVDPSVDQTANPEIVATCPDAERRLVRFVGAGDPRTGSTVFVTCSGE